MNLCLKNILARLAVGTVLAGPIASDAAADVKVAVTIKPVHSLVLAVMEGAGKPALVIPGASSPHTYTLTPSKATALQNAQVVFQIAPEFEISLTPAINKIAAKAVKANFEDIPGLRMLKPRGTHHHHAEEKKHDDDHHDEHDKDHKKDAHHDEHDKDHKKEAHQDEHDVDWHIWLDPKNAAAMTTHIAKVLAKTDPENATLYERNSAKVRDRLKGLETELRSQLASVRGKRFVAFHDAYHYFTKRFGLSKPHFITLNPQAPASAAHLKELYGEIKKENISCIFAEPQFNQKLISTIATNTGAKTSVLDPLGAEIKAGPTMYFTLLQNLARQFTSCLGS